MALGRADEDEDEDLGVVVGGDNWVVVKLRFVCVDVDDASDVEVEAEVGLVDTESVVDVEEDTLDVEADVDEALAVDVDVDVDVEVGFEVVAGAGGSVLHFSGFTPIPSLMLSYLQRHQSQNHHTHTRLGRRTRSSGTPHGCTPAPTPPSSRTPHRTDTPANPPSYSDPPRSPTTHTHFISFIRTSNEHWTDPVHRPSKPLIHDPLRLPLRDRRRVVAREHHGGVVVRVGGDGVEVLVDRGVGREREVVVVVLETVSVMCGV